MGVVIKDVYFHKDTQEAGNGEVLKLAAYSKHVLAQVTCTGENVTLSGKFQGQVFADGGYFDLPFVSYDSTTVSTNEFVGDGLYILDTMGLHSIRAKIETISDGKVTIRAKELG